MLSIACRIALAGLLAGASVAFAQGDLNLLCSAPIAWCEAMAVAFLKETGIRVKFAQKSATESLAQIAAERADPKHDLWFAGADDLHLQAAESGLTDEYRSPLLPQLHDWAVREAEASKWRTVGVHAHVLGIGYNADVVGKKHLPEPKCWSDLARAEYSGAVQIADPHAAGAGFSMLATFVQVFGEDRAFELLRAVGSNADVQARTNAGPIRAAARGETAIAITFLHDAAAEIAHGFPIRLVVPCEGAGYETGSMSIVRGAPNVANARRFYDWALTPPAQNIGAQTRNFDLPSNRDASSVPFTPSAGELKLITRDYARYASAAERKRLLDRWDREVNALPR